MKSDLPVGVFDSGLGGLTVVRQLRRQLPRERIIYFGDIARLPYGIKSEKQIKEFSIENSEFLLKQRVKALVVACNSSSSAAATLLSRRYKIPVVDVIRPAAEAAARLTKSGRIGVIATRATVTSGAYAREIRRKNSKLRVFSSACPLLVPFVEEGILNGRMTHAVLRDYLAPLLKQKIDTLILGCTHYPLLHAAIKDVVGSKIALVDSAPAAIRKLAERLHGSRTLSVKKRGNALQIFLSDAPVSFKKIGARFLGESLGKIRVVRYERNSSGSSRWVL